MPALAPTAAVEAIHDQVRRVRRRWNRYGLQRVVYRVLAATAAAAAAVVLLALRAPVLLFAAATVAVAAAVVAVTVAALASIRRTWMRARLAPEAIDRRSRLRGRLATLVELSGRQTVDPFFLPLLVDENVRRLPAWQPAAVVRQPVPLLALAAALAALAALLATLAIAPTLRPPPAPPGRDVAATGAVLQPTERSWRGEAAPPPQGLDDRRSGADERSAVARFAGSVQERIRTALWEETARPAVHAGRADAGTRDRDGSGAGARGPELARRPRGSDGRPAEASAADAPGPGREGEGRGRNAAASRRSARGGALDSSGDDAAGAAGAGAGSGTDRVLYAAPSDVSPDADGSFVLGIRARVHVRRAGPRPPEGEAPGPTPDQHPRLATGQRNASPVPRLAVPPDYEPIVRRLFTRTDARP